MPLDVLEKLGGWETREMVERYAHLSPSHVVRFADNARVHGTGHAA
jgi:beta-glucosidase/6-phospho-beta-glucosidase/beta-galactosidase